MTTTIDVAFTAFTAIAVLCFCRCLAAVSLKAAIARCAATIAVAIIVAADRALKLTASALKSAATSLESAATTLESAKHRVVVAATDSGLSLDLDIHGTCNDGGDACEYKWCFGADINVEVVVVPTFTTDDPATASMTEMKTTTAATTTFSKPAMPQLASTSSTIDTDIDTDSDSDSVSANTDNSNASDRDCAEDAVEDEDVLASSCCQCECSRCVFDDACSLCVRRACCVVEEERLGIQDVDDCSDFSECAADLLDDDDDGEYYGFDCSFFDKRGEPESECEENECELESESTFVYGGNFSSTKSEDVDGLSGNDCEDLRVDDDDEESAFADDESNFSDEDEDEESDFSDDGDDDDDGESSIEKNCKLARRSSVDEISDILAQLQETMHAWRLKDAEALVRDRARREQAGVQY